MTNRSPLPSPTETHAGSVFYRMGLGAERPSVQPDQPDATVADRYNDVHQAWRWTIPESFNIAEVCARRWASDPQRIALLWEDELDADPTTGAPSRGALSYADLQNQADRLSQHLLALGVGRGDRVAIILHQRPETAIAHIAIYQIGAVAMPLSVLFGPDALSYRLQDSAAKLAFVDDQAREALASVRSACPSLTTTVFVAPRHGGPAGVAPQASASMPEVTWTELLASPPLGSDKDGVTGFTPATTHRDDPAVLIYTSGTTGAPKGALIPHRALIGNMSGFVYSQDNFPVDGDVFWSPADWAWTGGLMDALLPTLFFGRTVVGYRGRFSARGALELMQRHRITNAFLFPTALKMMMKEFARPKEHFDLVLRAVMSAGEPVGETLHAWCRQALGITVNEMFGQTEINYVVGNSQAWWPSRAGSMGKAYPGHRVGVIDDAGQEVADGDIGEVAVHRYDRHGDPDPVFFLGYWNNERATTAKYTGDWCRTGDLAHRDAQGYLWYQGRADDMFKAAGYRIGPSEIENCLLKHPSVANCAVVPSPDEERGNIVKAFIVLAPGFSLASPEAEQLLVADLQNHVRGKLAPYEYPKAIEFIDALPMTTTGKVQRRILRELEKDRAVARQQSSGAV